MKRAFFVIGVFTAVWALVIAGPASAASWSPSVAVTSDTAGNEASGGPSCLPSSYPSGRYFVVFVYARGAKKYCSYSSEQNWIVGAASGDTRGINGQSGYSSIYVRDAGRNTEVSAHFNCYSAGRPCAVTTDTVTPGPSTVDWQFGYNTSCSAATRKNGISNEAQALRYTFQNLDGLGTGKFREVGIFPPDIPGDVFSTC